MNGMLVSLCKNASEFADATGGSDAAPGLRASLVPVALSALLFAWI